MSEKENPRQNLVGSISPQAGLLALTDSLKDFLRAELRTYKATVRKEGRGRFTDGRLAAAIQLCPANKPRVEIGEETLRRFLKNEPQRHGDDFIRTIALFLLHEKWITPADVAAHDKNVNLRAAIALQSFLGEQPQEDMLNRYRRIEGAYVNYAFRDDRLIKLSLMVTLNPEPLVLRVSEEVLEYRTSAAELLLRKTDGLDPARFGELPRLLASHAQQVGASRYSSGFGISDMSNLGFFVKSELTGQTAIYLVNRFSFDNSMALDKLRSIRYTGLGPTSSAPEVGFELVRGGSSVAGPLSTGVKRA